MKISRRDFIHAGCAITAASLVPDPVEAWIHGSVASNTNRVTINALGPAGSAPYINYAKGISWPTFDPTATDVNGYLQGTISSGLSANTGWDSNWFGDWIWSWSGTGSMWLPWPLIVRSTEINGTLTGNVINGLAGTSGTVSTAVVSGKNTPRIVFSFGVLITGMAAGASNGAGGSYINIIVGSTSNIPGKLIKIQSQTGQAAASGVWSYTVLNSTTIQLNNNNATGAVSAYNSSDPWTSGGEVIGQASNLSIFYGTAGGGTFTNFTNLVICKSGTPSGYAQTYEQLVAAGMINDPDYVTQLKYLFNHANSPFSNRGFLRFLDLDGERGYQCDSALRIPKAALTYANQNGTYFTPQATSGTYWGGAITTSDGTNFTVPNPTGRGTGAYADSEIVQGKFSLSSPTTNTSPLPTLQVGTRGAVPVFVEGDVANPHIIFSAAPWSGTSQNIEFTFTASWIIGGSYLFTYPTVSGDSNLSTFYSNLAAALNADATIGFAATGTNYFLSADLHVLCRNAGAGALTVSVTSNPTAATITIQKVPASSFVNGDYTTFVYSASLGGFIWLGNNAGMVMSVPWEQIVELCNLVGAHCWINWPLYTKAQYITDQADFFGDPTTGLTQGLRFGTETANEVWLAQVTGPYGQSLWLGSSLGFPYGSSGCVWGSAALRCLQYRELSMAAWTGKGRSASDHYIILESQIANDNTAPNSAFDKYALQGQLFNTTTNSVYAQYSGLAGGPAAADYTTSPNRPCDKITATGFATYWYSDYIGQLSTSINGTVTANAAWLQASVDYANGNTASAFSALVNLFAAPGTGVTHQGGDWQTFAGYFSAMESMVEQYDNSAGRATNGVNSKIGVLHYEGGPQWSFNPNNITNGTNSTSDSLSLNALATRMSNLGWDVSAYGSSPTDYSGVAQKVINLTQGWKSDTDHTGAAAGTASYKTMIKTDYYQALVNASAGKGREVKPAQYGYQANTWGLFPVSFELGSQYASYDAIREFNAGG